MPHADDAAQARLEYAAPVRQAEIELFWKRSLFFWGFIASAVGGLASIYRTSLALRTVFAGFAVLAASCWTLVNRGSKYGQENWEQTVHREEHAVLGAIFQSPDRSMAKGFLAARRFSMSRLTIALSDYTTAVALGLRLAQMIRLTPLRATLAHYTSYIYSGLGSEASYSPCTSIGRRALTADPTNPVRVHQLRCRRLAPGTMLRANYS